MWLLLAGCAPGPFTQDEAEAIFAAVTSVNEDVYAVVWSRTDPLEALDTGFPSDEAAAKSMQWNTSAEGGTFEGTLDGPGSWTGAVALTGTYGLDDAAYVWGMDAGYREIGFGTLGFSGDVRWEIEATFDGARAVHTSTVKGEITGSGSAAGTGTIDTITQVTLQGGRYTVETDGTVGGYGVGRSYDASAYAL